MKNQKHHCFKRAFVLFFLPPIQFAQAFIFLLLTASSAVPATSARADVLGTWTFNTGTTTAERLASSNVAPGVSNLYALVFNDTFDDFGPGVIPNSDNDGLGFGGNGGEQVAFVHRAASGISPTAFGNSGKVATAISSAPISFAVTAGAQPLKIDSLTIDITGGTAVFAVWSQVAGGLAGTVVNFAAGASATKTVYFPYAVTVEAGQSKNFTINLNSSAFNSAHYINEIQLNGSVIVNYDDKIRTFEGAARNSYDTNLSLSKWISGQTEMMRQILGNQEFDEMNIPDISERTVEINSASADLALMSERIQDQIDNAVLYSLTGGIDEAVNIKLDYQAVGNGTNDDSTAFRNAIAYAKSKGRNKVKIFIPAGTYLIDPVNLENITCPKGGIHMESYTGYYEGLLPTSSPNFHLLLLGITNLVFEGEMSGGEPLVTMKFGIAPQQGIGMLNCDNIQFQNMKFEYQEKPLTQGVVVDKDETNLTIDVDIAEGFPLPTEYQIKNANYRLLRFMATNTLSGTEFPEYYGVPSHIHYVGKQAALVSNRVYRYSVPADRIGDPFVGRLAVDFGRQTGLGRPFTVMNSDNITIHNCRLYDCYTAGMIYADNSGLLRIQDTQLTVLPGSGRAISGNADGLFVENMESGPHLSGCAFQSLGDDYINIHFDRKAILDRVDDYTIDILASGNQSKIEVGDRLGFINIDPDQARFFHENVVDSRELVNKDGTVVIRIGLQGILPELRTAQTEGLTDMDDTDNWNCDVIANMSRMAQGAVIEQNEFEYGFSRFMINARNFLFRSNDIWKTLVHPELFSTGITMGGGDGLNVNRDDMVARNLILDGNYFYFRGNAIGAAFGNYKEPTSTVASMRHGFLKNNIFECNSYSTWAGSPHPNDDCSPVIAHNAQHIMIESNTFVTYGGANINDLDEICSLGASSNVYVLGNQILAGGTLRDEADRVFVEDGASAALLTAKNKSWAFDQDLEGWSSQNASIAYNSGNGGVMDLAAQNNDPYIFSPADYVVPADACRYLVLKMRNDNANTQAAVYWERIDDTGFSGTKPFGLDLTPGVFTQYVIDLMGESNFNDLLCDLRVDPGNPASTADTFSIAELSLQDKSPFVWDFDSGDWSLVRMSSTLFQGAIELSATGNDPIMFSADNLNYQSSRFSEVVVWVKNNTGSSQEMRLYWQRSTDGGFSGTRSEPRGVPSNNTYTKYVFSLDGLTDYNGIIKQLRLDPASGQFSGEMAIDVIYLQ